MYEIWAIFKKMDLKIACIDKQVYLGKYTAEFSVAMI